MANAAELMQALEQRLQRDAGLRRDVEKAIKRNNQSWLEKLVRSVAKAVYGVAKTSVVRSVLVYLGLLSG